MPQSHISKVENGAIDLRLSSLVALADVLDLEATLGRRKAVFAVKSIIRSSERNGPQQEPRVQPGAWMRTSMADGSVLDALLYDEPIGTLFAFNDAYIEEDNRPVLGLGFKDQIGELITEYRPTRIQGDAILFEFIA